MNNKTKVSIAIVFLLLVLHNKVVLGQDFGKSIPKPPQDMITQEDAIILSRSYDVVLKNNWKSEYVLKVRMKLLSDRACVEFGEINIPYAAELQEVKNIKAHTITTDGKRLKAKKISDYMPEKELPIYGGYFMKLITMRGLEKGCEIEYSYKMKSKDQGTYGLFNDTCIFTQSVFVKHTRYSVTLPSHLFLYYHKNNVEKEPEISKKSNEVQYVWELDDIEPFKLEAYSPPYLEIASWISISTSKQWEHYINKWISVYKIKSGLSPEMKKLTKELIAGSKTERESAERIFNYVQNKIRYLAIGFGTAAWIPFSSSRVFTDKAGDCKGKTVLMITMLKAAGIQAYPALTKTRQSGRMIKEFCDDTQFDHAIPVAEIDNKLLWMDPSSKVRFEKLPYFVQDVDALVLKKNGGGFQKTPASNAADNKTEHTIKYTLKADGSINGHLDIQGYGIHELPYRSILENTTDDLREQFFYSLFNEVIPQAEISNVKYSDYMDTSKHMHVQCDFSASNFADKADELLIISPISSVEKYLKYTLEDRSYDLDFMVKDLMKKKEEITIPEGYIVKSLPSAYKNEGPYFVADINYALENRTLKRRLYYEKLCTVIPRSEHQRYKKSINQFMAEANKKIILIKEKVQ